MRVRKKKHGAERISSCSYLLIEDKQALFHDAGYAFHEKRPICLEIGCGKGRFAIGTAAANPDINLIAMERVSDVACLALEKAVASGVSADGNLRFLIADAKELPVMFAPASLDCIYLNFSDPWPQNGYRKRRLTYRGFLDIYRSILKPGGILKFKTDNEGLFDFSLEEFAACGLDVFMTTRNLHESEYAQGNILTEYEINFTEKGMPIYSAYVRF